MNEEEKGTMGRGWYGWCCGRRWYLFIPLFIAFAVAMVFAVGGLVMYLWNAVVPHVFTSMGPITYCQAIFILILCKILFGGIRKGGGWGGRGGRFHRNSQCKEKWMNMSEEERSKFKEEWKNRCC